MGDEDYFTRHIYPAECPLLAVEALSADGFRLFRPNAFYTEHIAPIYGEHPISHPREVCPHTLRIDLIGERGDILRATPYVIETYGMMYAIQTSEANLIELLAKGVDKGFALLDLAARLGIREDRVYTVGDATNDLGMLRAGAIGFAPANGDPRALEASDVILPTNDEHIIMHLIEYLKRTMQ